MVELGLLLWLVAAPSVDPVSPEPAIPVERLADPCELAREIASRGPCLRAEDCGAYQDWKRLFGVPRTEPLDPKVAAAASRRPTEVPQGYLCPAQDRAAAEPQEH